jgi:hypothetical protein
MRTFSLILSFTVGNSESPKMGMHYLVRDGSLSYVQIGHETPVDVNTNLYKSNGATL